MAYIWGPRLNGSEEPIWGPQLETEPQSVGGTQLAADYGLIVAGSSVVSVPASMGGRSGLIAAGYQEVALSVVAEADTGLVIFGFQGDVDIGSGEVVLEADYGLEIVGAAEIESEGVSLESDYGLTIVGFDLGASTPQIDAIVAQVTAGVLAGVSAALPGLVSDIEIVPGITFKKTQRALLSGTAGDDIRTKRNLAPNVDQTGYTDAVDKGRVRIRTVIDENGARRVVDLDLED